MAELNFEQGLERLATRTRVARAMIAAFLAVSVLAAIAALGDLSGAVDLETEEVDAVSLLAGISYLLYFAVFVASIVVIGMWIWRAHANLRAAGIEGLLFSPGWAVGWFFVPLANLFKPLQAMRELWTVSHDQADSFAAPVAPRLSLWWGSWIVGNILSNVSLRLAASGGEEAVRAAALLDLVSTVALIVCAFNLRRIIGEVDAAQRSMVGLARTFA